MTLSVVHSDEPRGVVFRCQTSAKSTLESVVESGVTGVRLGVVVGFVRKRPSRTRGTRYQAVAVLDGTRVPFDTFDTFALATDAWQHAETAARRGAVGADPRAGRRPFADVAEEYLATQQLAPSTRKSYTSQYART
jgi:hypothetical protein